MEGMQDQEREDTRRMLGILVVEVQHRLRGDMGITGRVGTMAVVQLVMMMLGRSCVSVL